MKIRVNGVFKKKLEILMGMRNVERGVRIRGRSVKLEVSAELKCQNEAVTKQSRAE